MSEYKHKQRKYTGKATSVNYSRPMAPKGREKQTITYEPPHDKTNKMSVRPAKTQISLGIHPVWSESSLSAWNKLGSLATH